MSHSFIRNKLEKGGFFGGVICPTCRWGCSSGSWSLPICLRPV